MFAGLGFGVSFLFGRFLDTDGDSSGSDSEAGGSASRTERNGQAVDLVIKDEDLPAEEGTGQYFVGSNHQMLTKDDVRGVNSFAGGAQQAYSREKPAAEPNGDDLNETGGFSSNNIEADKQFVPVRNLETLYNVSGKEAVTKENPAAPRTASLASGEETFAADAEELDTLPAMDDLGFESSSPSAGGEEGINSDSEFATAGGSGGSSRRHQEDAPEVKDAPLLAKAISTILANES